MQILSGLFLGAYCLLLIGVAWVFCQKSPELLSCRSRDEFVEKAKELGIVAAVMAVLVGIGFGMIAIGNYFFPSP